MKVTPDIAAIYVKYIKKNCKPKDNEFYSILDKNGNEIKMLYKNIVELAKQSKREADKEAIRNEVWLAQYQMKDINQQAQTAVDMLSELLSQVINMKADAEQLVISSSREISPFKTIKPRTK